MARITQQAKEETGDPLAWISEGRWQGDRRFSVHDHECDRALWLAARWAEDRAPALKHVRHAPPAERVAAMASPPPRETGLAEIMLCGSCPRRRPCQGELARNCRTCRHVSAGDGWRCLLDGAELDVDMQRAGCDRWQAVREGGLL